MKKVVLLFLCLVVAVVVKAQQFADSTAVKQYISDNIRDKRPDKVTADQLRQALLGVSWMPGKYNLLNTRLRNNTGAAGSANMANQAFIFDSAGIFGVNFKSYLSETTLAQWALVPAGMVLSMPGTNAANYVFGPNFNASNLSSYSLNFGGATNFSLTSSAINLQGITNATVTTPNAHLYVGSDYAEIGNNSSYLYVGASGVKLPLLANVDTNKVLTADASGVLKYKTIYPSSEGGGEFSGLVSNGLHVDVDSIKLGGSLTDEATELHIPESKIFRFTGANSVDTMSLNISQNGGANIELMVHDTAATGLYRDSRAHINVEELGTSFQKIGRDDQGFSNEDELYSDFFMQSQFLGSRFQKNKIVQVGEDYRNVRQYENIISQSVDEFNVQTRQINPGFGETPYRKNLMVFDSTGFRVDSANGDGWSEGMPYPVGTVFKVNTYDASITMERYKNNSSEDSVLTTDENGVIKMKYLSANNSMFPAQYVAVKMGITSNTTLDATATYWKFDCSGGDISVTLPSPSAVSSWISTGSNQGYGIKYFIQKADNSSHVLTIVANTGDSIDGQAQFQLYNSNSFITIYSDGTNWYSN